MLVNGRRNQVLRCSNIRIMTALELAIKLISGKGKISLSEKQSNWLFNLLKKEGKFGIGCLGETGNIIDGRKETIFLKEGKHHFSAYGGWIGKKGTGKYFLITYN